MIKSEIRKGDGSFKDVPSEIDNDIKKVMTKLYKKHGKKVSYDALHLMITDASFCHRTLEIALNACIKKN